MHSTETTRKSNHQTRGTQVAALLIAVTAIAGTVLALAHQVTSTTTSSASLEETDGAVPAGTSVFDNIPGVTNFDPALLEALRRAATDARQAGLTLLVNSGWRSPQYQEHLLHQAITTYGSAQEAARWVATPTTSAHVAGHAVDIGPPHAATWLAQHGGMYGLCRIYANEPWHFELRPTASTNGCPKPYPDVAHDPRHRPNSA